MFIETGLNNEAPVTSITLASEVHYNFFFNVHRYFCKTRITYSVLYMRCILYNEVCVRVDLCLSVYLYMCHFPGMI